MNNCASERCSPKQLAKIGKINSRIDESKSRKLIYDRYNVDETDKWSQIAREYIYIQPTNITKFQLSSLISHQKDKCTTVKQINPLDPSNMSRNMQGYCNTTKPNANRMPYFPNANHQKLEKFNKVRSKLFTASRSKRKLDSEEILMKAAIVYGDPFINTKRLGEINRLKICHSSQKNGITPKKKLTRINNGSENRLIRLPKQFATTCKSKDNDGLLMESKMNYCVPISLLSSIYNYKL